LRAAHLIAPRGNRGAGRIVAWGLAAAVAVVGVAALDALRGPSEAERAAPLDPASLLSGHGARNYKVSLADLESNLEGKQYLLAREPGDWLRMEGVARALLARARLNASAADLHQANSLLAAGIDSAPWPAGPTLSRAGAALSVHDLAGTETALVRFDASVTPPSELEATEARAMRCEIAFERGDLAKARTLCNPPGDLGIDLRRANLALAGGDPVEAAQILEIALQRPRQSPFQLAKMMLQRAAVALAAGQWEAAGRWSRAADTRFPGYWLAEAFVAQSRALEGDTAGAEGAYRAIAERTGNPDIYGALVVLAEARGDVAATRAYLAAARKGWEGRVALLPDTYGGHYAEHLALSGEMARALTIAEEDYRRRPYLQPMTDYVFVLDVAGMPKRIVEVVEQGERRGFRSATLLLAKANALNALGRKTEAVAARQRALEINPRVEQAGQAFVHFRQD